MINTEKINESRKRILSIEWKGCWPPKRSNGLLIKEYLRSMDLWRKSTSNPSDCLLFNISKYISTSETPSQNDIKEHLSRSIFTQFNQDLTVESTRKLPDIVIDICMWYIEFSFIETIDSPKQKHIPKDPYEPLILMFERQGAIESFQSNYIYTNNGVFSVHANAWINHPQILYTLSKQELDTFDQDDD